jgi:hypothetical protein
MFAEKPSKNNNATKQTLLNAKKIETLSNK